MNKNVFYLLEDNARRIHTSTFTQLLGTFGVHNVKIIQNIGQLREQSIIMRAKRSFLITGAADLSLQRYDFSQVPSFAGCLLFCGPHEDNSMRWAVLSPDVIFLTHNFKELRRAVVWLAAGGSFTSSGDPIAPAQRAAPPIVVKTPELDSSHEENELSPAALVDMGSFSSPPSISPLKRSAPPPRLSTSTTASYEPDHLIPPPINQLESTTLENLLALVQALGVDSF